MTHGEHRCAECDDGLEHCHGTLLEHLDGQRACTEDGCGLPDDAHAWIGRCVDVGCDCAPAVSVGARAA